MSMIWVGPMSIVRQSKQVWPTLFSFQGKSNSHKGTNSLVRSEHIRRIECQGVRIVWRRDGISIGVILVALVERVVGACNDKWVSFVRCPVQQVFHAEVELGVF